MANQFGDADSMRTKPGIWIIIMGSWWNVPFFIISLFQYSLVHHFFSYLPFFILWALVVLSALMFKDWPESESPDWSRSKSTCWQRSFFLCAVYTANITALLVVLIELERNGIFRGFADPVGGVICVLWLPTAVINGIVVCGIGIFLSIFSSPVKPSTERQPGPWNSSDDAEDGRR